MLCEYALTPNDSSSCNTEPMPSSLASTHQVVIDFPTMKELQDTMNEDVDAKLKENNDQREPEVVFHVLFFDVVQGWKPNLPMPGKEGSVLVDTWLA